MKVKYPKIKVKLTGKDGNAFAIMGRVKQALQRGGVAQEEIKKFIDAAMAGDYDNLLRICMEWVDVS